MELLQLRYFFDSARTENFAKTAEKYMVPPSSVSASIKRLEKEIGVSLFDRSSNRIVLNENGRKLQRSLGVIFDELDRTVLELTHPESDEAEIKILVRSLRGRMTKALIEYQKKHPNVRFKTVFDFGDTDYKEYDLIIDEKNDRYSEYEKFELCSLRVRLCVSESSPLCGRPLTLKQLRHHSFITMGSHSNLHRILVKSCKNAGFIPNIVMEINDVKCYWQCINAEMGIGITRESSDYPSAVPSNFLFVTDLEERQTFYVYYKSKILNANLQNFIEFLRRKSDELD